MRIEIRTANEITSIPFPSITDASLESAVFFIDNGWTESAKRVIENMARDMREMAVYSVCKIEEMDRVIDSADNHANKLENRIVELEEIADSEEESANYWRMLCESRTTQLDIMREANEKLVSQNKQLEWIADDKSNTIRIWREHYQNAYAEKESLIGQLESAWKIIHRQSKAFCGISKGYGRLKRAFNAHTKKINRLNSEIANLANENIQEQMFADKMMAQNAELIERLSMYESL